MTYKIVTLYHPSHRVPSLEKADTFFREVFGIESVWRNKLFTKPDPKYPTFPTDYCIFTSIADVFFDCIDPKKYVIDGEQRYEDVEEPHLNGLGWGVEGIDEIYAWLNEMGVRSTDQANRLADPKECPVAVFKPSKLFFTVAEDSGLRYEYYPASSMGTYDIRRDPSWKLNPQVGKGPLGIQFCSHHTILTANLSRAIRLFVDLMGGKQIHETKGTLRGTDSIFIQLADAVYEFAVPIPGVDSYASRDFEARQNKAEDVYHALTWKVKDLAVTEAHLRGKGVELIAKDDSMLVVDPKDGLGIPWGFVADVLPGDDRYTSELQ
ncbi:hypothetical protein Z517_11183 [Fonsecaea pedrosoi CBS 271.37]|uniref:Unplaced genomic scaffold supercont1.7, whole genome shotgun sequence n=1 Tax=Fonsecaea pedrosoi CBS 271.37 TaxID=1442368 RepID=A0A0D2EQ33_9EURO|nr:uncharacterized protein Z517_11183 [Fonsecaea pedrosoi CBS 271.37]KIW76437.1 hypothetical protein Z517_11183 [Fonsecaea pedrosoi CBS 271.37]